MTQESAGVTLEWVKERLREFIERGGKVGGQDPQDAPGMILDALKTLGQLILKEPPGATPKAPPPPGFLDGTPSTG